MRIIKITKCYNCPYRDHFIYDEKAIWVCEHPERDRLQISDVMDEPPKWCPLEYTENER